MDPVYCMPPGSYYLSPPMEASATAIPINGGYMIPQQQAYALQAPPPGTIPMPLTTAVPHRANGGMLSQYEYDCLIYQMGRLNTSSRGHMPDWLFDEDGKIAVSLQEVVEHDLFFVFLRDKKGSQFVQDNFPCDDCPLRRQLFQMVLDSHCLYNIAMDMFGNFVIQKMIAESGDDFGAQILDVLSTSASDLAFNRFSCRVIQKAVDTFTPEALLPMLHAFRGYVLTMSIDQSANHVLQKILDHVPAESCEFIIDEMCSGSNMDQIICNKFGCRVVQFCVEKLAMHAKITPVDGNVSIETKMIRKMLEKISRKAYTYCQDEFANYIIQYILKTRNLSFYKDRIINKSLRGNIVALSQAKYSSHVMEQAFEYANYPTLLQLTEEVFNGRVNQKNGRSSLDQMLFDQFGNYVIQRLLNIAIQMRRSERPGEAVWFPTLSEKIIENAQPLLKYSSGKKIIDILSRELGYDFV